MALEPDYGLYHGRLILSSFLKLVDEQYTILQLTIKRLDNLKLDVAPPIIICNEDHRFIVAEQLDKLGWKMRLLS